jgi:uncharacterized protein
MSATLTAVATGRFVWRDLMTTDPARAKAFYTALFGWTISPMEMGEMTYDMLSNDGKHFGGVVQLSSDHGVPSHWISYVTVGDVDEAAATATRLGGSVHVPPTDIPGVGRFGVVADPQGAVFSPFVDAGSSDEAPAEMERPPVGGVAWNELVTADPEGAKAFYGEVVGWQFGAWDMGGGEPYTLLVSGERQEGGLMRKPAESPVSRWVIYFAVADIDQTLADATRLGGQPAGPIIEVPTIGRVSWATDPTGALFALHEGLTS